MSVWLPGVDRIPGNGSGSWASDDEDAPKLVLHTTEGGSIGGATAAYKANNSWPHVTADPRRRRIVQHVPLDTPARALRNTSVPGQTNREARTIQLEIVATARTDAPAGLVSVLDLTDEELDWLGAHVVGPMCGLARVPLSTSVTFYGDRAGFTLATASARQRLSAAAWDTYRGVLGHQHVPENTHWDPGPLDVARILAAAGGTNQRPPTKGWLDMLTPEQQQELYDKTNANHLYLKALYDDYGRKGRSMRQVILVTAERLRRLVGITDGIDDKVDELLEPDDAADPVED